ncbi:MAG: tetratricopeptide repeat protein [Planctomycetota bacterium]|nr:tetratricopeptide repeat protein [Planctomycetota bacterium]
MKARSVRTLAGIVMALVIVAASSCQVSPKSSGQGGARARKAGEVLPLVISRIAPAADHYYSTNEKVAVQPSFDPGIINVEEVTGYKLWLKNAVSGTWEQVAISENLPITYEAPGEGIHGFRVSVVLEGDREFLIPQGTEDAQIWFCVDNTPPVVKWTGAGKTFFFSGKSRLSLTLEISEQQLGKSPVEVEWSLDDGGNWSPVTTRIARNGEQSFSWFFPQGVEGEVLVRASVKDLAGLVGFDTLILRNEGGSVVSSLDAPAPEAAEAVEGESVATVEASDAPPPPDASQADVEPVEAEEPEEPEVVIELPPALEFVSPETECLLAGDEIEVAWKVREEPAAEALDPKAETMLEFYSPAEDSWIAVGDALVEEGVILWTAPEMTLADCRLRLVVGAPASPDEGVETGSLSFESPLFGIDASAPTAACKELPQLAGGHFSFEVELTDEGCAEPVSVQAFLRAEGEEFWNNVPPARVNTESSEGVFTVTLDLQANAEKKFDLYLAATDSLGNVAAAPGVGSESLGMFQLDNSAPLVAIGDPAADWVAGLPATLQVQIDPSDCEGPLVLEGRAPQENKEWIELATVDDLAFAEDGVHFTVPLGWPELEVRVSARDAMGNVGHGLLSARRLKSAVRLDTMARGGVFQAFDKQEIAWTLQEAALEAPENLLMKLEYRVGDSGAWELLREEPAIATQASFEWVLPDASDDDFALRVSLYRGADLIGEDISGSFRIEGLAKTEDGVLKESLIVMDSAVEKEKAWRERYNELSLSGAPVEAAAQAELAGLAQAAISDYDKAVSLDSKNSEATFRLSMLLNDVDPEANSDKILSLLEKTLEEDPANMSAQMNLGAVLIQRNELDRAQGVLEKALAQEDTGQARFNLALTFLFKGDAGAARLEFERALAKGGDVPEGLAWFYIAWAHAEEGNVDTARDLYARKKNVIPEEFQPIIEEKLK